MYSFARPNEASVTTKFAGFLETKAGKLSLKEMVQKATFDRHRLSSSLYLNWRKNIDEHITKYAKTRAHYGSWRKLISSLQFSFKSSHTTTSLGKVSLDNMLFYNEQIDSMQIWAQATGTVTGQWQENSDHFGFLCKEKIVSDD